MKKIIYLTMIAANLFCSAYCQNRKLVIQETINELESHNEEFHLVRLISRPEVRSFHNEKNDVKTFIHYVIDESELQNVIKANYQSIKFEIPTINGSVLSLIVTKHKILTDDFKFTVTDRSGLHEIKSKHQAFYYGIIDGQKTPSIVTLSIFDNEFSATITDESGNWILGPLNENEYSYYNDNEFPTLKKYTCGTKDDHVNTGTFNHKSSLSPNVSNCVRLFIDNAYDFYLFKGSNVNTVYNYVTAMFNEVSTLFGNENINVVISSFHVWATPSPFDESTDNTVLNTFSAFYPSFNGDVGHLIIHNGGNGGAAMDVGTLCTSERYCFQSLLGTYSASDFSFPIYTDDAQVCTHEIGHVLGSHHTQWCGWVGGAIDNCAATEGGCPPGPDPGPNGGTIMSYCNGNISFLNGFGPQPGNAIRMGVANAGCLTSCIGTCLQVVSVGADISAGNSVSYAASDILYANAAIASGAIVTVTGGNTVQLNPGFSAAQGSFFHAWNASCSSKIISIRSTNLPSLGQDIKKDNSNDGFFTAYPNPTSSNIHINITTGQNENNAVINVFSNEMKFIKQINLGTLKAGKQSVVINLQDLSSGVYFLVAQLQTQKLITKISLIK